MYDCIVVGLGGMGSAAAAHLAQRGQRVAGFEQFAPAHNLGSSHGKSRIIRQAYFEDPAYVPLLLRAYELWHDLELRCGQTLYVRTGGLMVGSATSPLIGGSQRSAREHGLAFEVLDASAIAMRFPAMRPHADEVGVFEAPAGLLLPERCVQAHLAWAQEAGADLRFHAAVSSWGSTTNGAAYVCTAAGERVEAATLVLCLGAWLEKCNPDLNLRVRIERNVMHWFAPQSTDAVADLSSLPVYILDRAGDALLYGFPFISGEGSKAAFHHSGIYTTADALDRSVSADEVAAVWSVLRSWVPDAAGQHIASAACMYSMTPDEHFIVGEHPRYPNILIAGGFSGHGFKFCSVMGEILADLAIQRSTRHPIALFSPLRFAN